MNSILQRYEHFATWTKNIFILLIFCSLYNDIHRILQSGKHILAAHNEQKIVQSKVCRFYVVFAANTHLAKSCNFTLKNAAKSCKFTLKKVAKSCNYILKNLAKSCIINFVYIKISYLCINKNALLKCIKEK